MRSLGWHAIALALLLSAAAPAPSSSQQIWSPVDGVVNSGSPGFGDLVDTYNQAGMLSGFVSGVTDFDAYISTTPFHSYIFSGHEWWSAEGRSTASVTYDFGEVLSVDRFALWNEESAGIGTLDLFGSVNGVDFFSLASGLTPTNHSAVPPVDYFADVYSWSSTNLRYVRMDMSDCPQANVGSGYEDFGCSIGEVAISARTAVAIPEPLPASLLLTALCGLLVSARFRGRAETA